MRNLYREFIEERRDPNGDLTASIRFLLIILGILALLVALFTFVWGGVRVEGNSMMNTLYDGDYVFVNKLSSPQRGDIVVVHTARANAEFVIKRVIALEGDAIYAEEGVLYRRNAGERDFTIVQEDYLPEPWQNAGANMPNSFGSREDPLVLEDGMFFYMGDNRNDSYDCRAYGAQPIEHVWGTVTDWSLAGKRFFTACFHFLTFGVSA